MSDKGHGGVESRSLRSRRAWPLCRVRAAGRLRFTLFLCLGLAAGCRDATERAEPPETAGVAARAETLEGLQAGTRRMAERLAALEDPLRSSGRVAELQASGPPTDPRGALVYRLQLTRLQLRSGQTAEALSTIEEIRRLVRAGGVQVPPVFLRDVVDLSAIAHLRQGFEANCVDGRSTACLFPTPPGDVWTEIDGPRVAISEYELLLSQQPDDPTSRWLLNLANMVLGRHPEGVREKWRILPAAFADDDSVPRFPDLAHELGVDVLGRAGGIVTEDFDGDGDLDLMASGQALSDSIRFFRNEGDGRFTERTREAGLTGLVGGLNLVHADYDNDGDADVLVLRGGWAAEGQPNSLLRNEGGGTFVDVTEAAGVLSSHPTQTAAWGDFDGDGWLDLFIGNESERRADPPRIHPSELYHSDGDGTFTNVAREVGLDVVGYVKSVVWGDYDNDGDPDLYLSLLDDPNLLYRNDGAGPDGTWRFSDVTRPAGVAQPGQSFPAWFWDYDNDGWLDLFVSGYLLQRPENFIAEYVGRPEADAVPRLYRNRGDGSFADVTAAMRLERVLYTMGSNFGDLDNDGWLDFYAGTGWPDLRALVPNRMFRNDGGRRFGEVTASGGFGHLAKGHGVAFGDLDLDGDQDLYVVLGGMREGDASRNALWVNPGSGNAWITLRLEGREANRSAIGARVRVTVEMAGGQERDVHHLVGTGGSFGSSSLQAEIGLGEARRIRRLEIRWPGSGSRDVYRDLSTNRVYRIREGAASPEDVPVRAFSLGSGPTASPAQ